MSPERNVFETIRGLETCYKAIDITRKAIVNSYPVFASDDYTKSLPSRSNISFVSTDQLAVLENDCRPFNGNEFCLALKEFGLTQAEVMLIHNRSLNSNVFQNPNTEQYYVDENLLAGASDPSTENIAAIQLGCDLAKSFIQNMPDKIKLPVYPWKQVVRSKAEHLIESNVNGKVTRDMLRAKGQMIKEIEDQNSSVYTKGATVNLAFGKSNHKLPDIVLGENFDKGIVNFLAEPITLKILRELDPKSQLIRTNLNTDLDQYSIQICKKIEPLKKVFLNRQKFIDYYLDSTIPLFYLYFKDPALNPNEEFETGFTEGPTSPLWEFPS